MAYSRVILREAQREYEGIVRYLAMVLKSPGAASHFIEEFSTQLDRACEFPEAFGLSHLAELAARGYRSFPVQNYLALYKFENEQVIVAHVFHQSQDYARLV